MPLLRPSTFTSRLLSVLLVVMLLAQTLGALHKVAHARGMGGSATTESGGFIDSLWGHQQGDSSDCQAFDQSCPDLLGFSDWHLSLPESTPHWIVADAQAQFAHFERYYSSRGPPVTLK
jgi:hypothetical protein